MIGVAPIAIFVSVGDTAKSLALDEDVMADWGKPGGQLFGPLIGRRLLLDAHSRRKVGGMEGSCKEV